jgi:peptidoglycan/LPS O-acetylase OafA/YrhL
MNKAWLGLILGGILGIFDGLTAWFYPEVRPQIAGIIIGSTFKGLIAGVIIGAFARKVNSLPIGILFGLGVGLVLAFAVAAMPNPAGKHYYFEIMLPGGIVGMIVGYATQRFGRGGAQPARPQSA